MKVSMIILIMLIIVENSIYSDELDDNHNEETDAPII